MPPPGRRWWSELEFVCAIQNLTYPDVVEERKGCCR
jgi:hypothetical protein